VVLDALLVGPCRFVHHRNLGGVTHVVERVEAGAAADAVDGLESAGGNEPRARIAGNALAGPLLEGGPECVMERLLGDVEVAEQTDERGEDAARFGQVDGVHRLVNVIGRGHGDRSHHLHLVPATSQKLSTTEDTEDRRLTVAVCSSVSSVSTVVASFCHTMCRDKGADHATRSSCPDRDLAGPDSRAEPGGADTG